MSSPNASSLSPGVSTSWEMLGVSWTRVSVDGWLRRYTRQNPNAPILTRHFSPEENQQLLRRIRDAVEPGARLLLADFWTDATHTEPLMAALMAGEFAVHVRHGDVYSVSEAQQWLDATGWQLAEHLPLAGPVSLLTAEGQ